MAKDDQSLTALVHIDIITFQAALTVPVDTAVPKDVAVRDYSAGAAGDAAFVGKGVDVHASGEEMFALLSSLS